MGLISQICMKKRLKNFNVICITHSFNVITSKLVGGWVGGWVGQVLDHLKIVILAFKFEDEENNIKQI